MAVGFPQIMFNALLRMHKHRLVRLMGWFVGRIMGRPPDQVSGSGPKSNLRGSAHIPTHTINKIRRKKRKEYRRNGPHDAKPRRYMMLNRAGQHAAHYEQVISVTRPGDFYRGRAARE